MNSQQSDIRVVEVTAENLPLHPGAICFINPKHPCHHHKIEWLREQFLHGLKIKLLYLADGKRPSGFIEYVPGEHCWRAVQAPGYLFIHCLWITGKKLQHQGLGSRLLREVEVEAGGRAGVAVVTSEGPFMAGPELFLKNGYSMVARTGLEQLLVKQFREGPLPAFNPGGEREIPPGWVIVYSKQCPWVARFLDEAIPLFEKYHLHPVIIELRTAGQAQHSPAVYGVFSLFHDGRLLAGRYISTTRFLNILKKEIGF